MNLTVGQKVKVYDPFRNIATYEGEVTKVGRKLVTIQWSFDGLARFPHEAQFRMEDGNENGGGRYRFKTVEQAEADDRRDAARKTLMDAGLRIDYQCVLTNPQIEELAATVKHMLSEKPADYDSEIKGASE